MHTKLSFLRSRKHKSAGGFNDLFHKFGGGEAIRRLRHFDHAALEGGAPPRHPYFLESPPHSIRHVWDRLLPHKSPPLGEDDLPKCHEMVNDVRIAIVAGHGYKTMRAQASYAAWGRCVPASRITYYSEEDVGDILGKGIEGFRGIPSELVHVLNETAESLPFHLLPIQNNECGGMREKRQLSNWLLVVGVDTFINLANLDVAITELASAHESDGPPVLAGEVLTYHPSEKQKFVSLAGGILMNRAAVKQGLCKVNYAKGGNCYVEETSNQAVGVADCLERVIGKKLVYTDDNRFNAYFGTQTISDETEVRSPAVDRVDDYVSVGYLDPPSQLTLGGIARVDRNLYDGLLDLGHHESLSVDDIFVMTITGQSVEWRARAVRDSWFRWANSGRNGTARFFSEAQNSELNTVPLNEAKKGHAGSAKIQMILEWTYQNELYRPYPNDKILKYKWFVMTDDDTYIRFPRLVRFLGHYDSRVPTYMGRCQYKTVLGGPGIVLSAAAMVRLREAFLDKDKHRPGASYGDMWIGARVGSEGMRCTDESVFYDRSPAELPDDPARAEHAMSFHMSGKEIPGLFWEDVRSYPDLAL